MHDLTLSHHNYKCKDRYAKNVGVSVLLCQMQEVKQFDLALCLFEVYIVRVFQAKLAFVL